jgi:hypothetical protein
MGYLANGMDTVCGTDLHIHEGQFIAKVRDRYFMGLLIELSSPSNRYFHVDRHVSQ